MPFFDHLQNPGSFHNALQRFGIRGPLPLLGPKETEADRALDIGRERPQVTQRRRNPMDRLEISIRHEEYTILDILGQCSR